MKPLVTAATLTVAAVLLSACGSPEPAAVTMPVTERASSAPVSFGPVLGSRFFAPIRPGPAMDLKMQPPTLDQAYAEASAVVEADVVGVRAGREIGGMSSVIVTLAPARVLRGALRPDIGVDVEFGPIFDPADVRRIAGTMDSFPPARGVWLLRWQGEPSRQRKPGAPRISSGQDPALYRTVHPNCGVFVQGPEHVEAPSAQDDTSGHGAQAEAERFTTLAELADHAVIS